MSQSMIVWVSAGKGENEPIHDCVGLMATVELGRVENEPVHDCVGLVAGCFSELRLGSRSLLWGHKLRMGI